MVNPICPNTSCPASDLVFIILAVGIVAVVTFFILYFKLLWDNRRKK
jgi:hypothetical protein